MGAAQALCPLLSREAALALQQPHWEVFLPLTLQQMRRQELCGAWGMHHPLQGLAGEKGFEGLADHGDMTHGAQRVYLGSQCDQ